MINLLGIFGYPVTHSLSPHMHNAVCKKLNLSYFYAPFEILPENLGQAVNSIRILGIKGINVTIPHKENVLKFLDEITPSARMIGAVNTIKNENGKLTGYNTDGPGFISALEENFETKTEGKSFLILGAGGAARAIAVQLAIEKAKKIIIVNRTLSRAENIRDNIKQNIPSSEIEVLSPDSAQLPDIVSNIDILINTTSVGMKKEDPSPIDLKLLSRKISVTDIIYNPSVTLLLREARKIGCKTANGIDMLVFQGALAFEIWTGIKPPVEIMRKTLLKML